MEKNRLIAYFCAEFGGKVASGGLGYLARDWLKAAADERMPVVAVGLYYSRGNHHQVLTDGGWQNDEWDGFTPQIELVPEGKVKLALNGEDISVIVGKTAERSSIPGAQGSVTQYLLTTVGNNKDYSSVLYPSDGDQQLIENAILGIGGVEVLEKLGLAPDACVMNEGDSAPLVLALTRKYGAEKASEMTFFVTHTSVPAAIREVGYDKAKAVFHDYLPPAEEFETITGSSQYNNMRTAMGYASYARSQSPSVFGVSDLHTRVSRALFSDYRGIEQISRLDNAVHLPSWVSPEVIRAYEGVTDGRWRREPETLEWLIRAVSPQRAHEIAEPGRMRLTELMTDGRRKVWNFGREYDPDKTTFAWNRRFAPYKDPLLMFHDATIDRLVQLGDTSQVVFAGKSHPNDKGGKDLIAELFRIARDMPVPVFFIEDYDADVAAALAQGADAAINTPMLLKEASGTSGMKFAANFRPVISKFDGWTKPEQPSGKFHMPHGLWHGMNGWGIGRMPTGSYVRDIGFMSGDQIEAERRQDALQLISVMEEVAAMRRTPGGREELGRMMVNAAAMNAYYSATRMVRDYMEAIDRRLGS
ncbi:MAG: alpha-glucan family phosphorylase [archaeon]